MKKQLMLISNSFCYGGSYLDHCIHEVKSFLKQTKNLLFIPYADVREGYDDYEKLAQMTFKQIGINVLSIHRAKNAKEAVLKAEAIFIGGGNTFRLLDNLYKKGIMEVLQKKIIEGTPYIGSSAGSNVACPTIKTTNDMPIVYPPSFEAIGVVPFQINPHYIDADPASQHMGETREKRIEEFHEENNIPVVGLREGSWLKVIEDKMTLGGKTGARLFQQGESPREISQDESLRFLLREE